METNKRCNAASFCTCTDRACPCHPVNHDLGCLPCIQKNRAQREIPSCFFNMLHLKEKPKAYTFESFASLVLAEEKTED